MVIKTILDTDLYKFTTSYAYIKLFPYALGTFTFKDRDETEYTEGFLEALKMRFTICHWFRSARKNWSTCLLIAGSCRVFIGNGCLLSVLILTK